VNDVIVLVMVLGFFALAAAYVGWCDRIVSGAASEAPHTERLDADASVERAVAGAPSTEARP
jgi:hypothetical protein